MVLLTTHHIHVNFTIAIQNNLSRATAKTLRHLAFLYNVKDGTSAHLSRQHMARFGC
jgi:hypothetical protein